MMKKEAEREFREQVLPVIRDEYEQDGCIDRPARVEAWNNYTDALCKEGRITSQQYFSWMYPS